MFSGFIYDPYNPAYLGLFDTGGDLLDLDLNIELSDMTSTPSEPHGTPRWAALLALEHYPASKKNNLHPSFWSDLYCANKNPIEVLLTIKPQDPSENLTIAIGRLAKLDLEHFAKNHVGMIRGMTISPALACVWANTYSRMKQLLNDNSNDKSFEDIIISDRFQNELAVMSKFYILSKISYPNQAPKITQELQTRLLHLLMTSDGFTQEIRALDSTQSNLQSFLDVVEKHEEPKKAQNKKQKFN